MISAPLLRVAVALGVIGLAMGIVMVIVMVIVMGINQDVTLAPAHAHLNLLGFVVLFMAGLYYHALPQAAASLLAKMPATIAVIGAALFPAGIAAGLIGDHDRARPIIGALAVFLGMLLFAWIVYRTAAPKTPPVET